MRRHLHTLALALLLLTLVLDLSMWGAVPDLPKVGPHIQKSASTEALLASIYIALGQPLDATFGSLGNFGAAMMTDALSDGFARMVEPPNVCMDLILNESYNSTHGWVKILYWCPPILLVLFLILWAIRPKPVKLVGRR